MFLKNIQNSAVVFTVLSCHNKGILIIGSLVITLFSTMASTTDKRTDACSRDFMIWKINSRLVWAAGPYLWKKSLCRLWATFEGVFYVFKGKKRKFETIIASALKSCIEKRQVFVLFYRLKFKCKYMKVENKHSHLLGPCEIYPGLQNDWFSKLCLTVFNWVGKKLFQT